MQHKTDDGSNVLAYPSAGGDDHPSQAGNLKATAEFVPLLNDAYHRWASPSQPVDLKLWPYQVGGDRLGVAWNDVGATGYRLLFAETGQTMHQYGEVLDGGVHLATITGLGNATTYDVTLEALQGEEVMDTANITVRTAGVYVSSYQWDLEDQGNETALLTSVARDGRETSVPSTITSIYRCVDGADWVLVQTSDEPHVHRYCPNRGKDELWIPHQRHRLGRGGLPPGTRGQCRSGRTIRRLGPRPRAVPPFIDPYRRGRPVLHLDEAEEEMIGPSRPVLKGPARTFRCTASRPRPGS